MNYEEPKIEKDDSPVHETVETHPAYAQIGASRVTGRAYLYGSDFEHHNYITISIHRSELHRGLSMDWPHGREEYIEVMLSEAQWAAFVSSMNVGSGVQCTLNHLHGKGIPQLAHPPRRHAQFKSEAKGRLEAAMAELATLRQKITNSKLSGVAKEELLRHLEFARRDFGDNLEFVAKQFGEHMETVTEHAKTEVNAYIVGTITRTGLAALQGHKPIALPDKSE